MSVVWFVGWDLGMRMDLDPPGLGLEESDGVSWGKWGGK